MVFSDEYVAAVVPIMVYWGYSGVHAALGHGHVLDKYMLNTKAEEDSRNTVSKRAVLANVLMQHLMQLVAVILLTPVSTYYSPSDRHVHCTHTASDRHV
jgi:sphinganine C4-monooxygenase